MIILTKKKKNIIKKEYSIEKKCTKGADCKEFRNATCGSLKICRCNRADYFNTTRKRNIFQNLENRVKLEQMNFESKVRNVGTAHGIVNWRKLLLKIIENVKQ